VRPHGKKGEADKKNWCYLEFKEFDDWQENESPGYKRHYFILTHKEDVVYPVRMPLPYEKWSDKIKATKCVTDIYHSDHDEFAEKIKSLARELHNTKENILRGILGDFFDKDEAARLYSLLSSGFGGNV
jgi:hypothetical protein